MATPGSGNVVVGIFVPAFTYPAPLSHQAIVNAALEDFGLDVDACEFMRPDNDKIACVLKNSSMWERVVDKNTRAAEHEWNSSRWHDATSVPHILLCPQF